MMYETIRRFLKEQYEDFVPIWKWKVVPEKKKGKQALQYNQILNLCRVTQYFVAAIAVLFTLTFECSRNLFISAALRDGVLLLLMELSSFIFLGYFMGLKRLPANYISLVIIKSFVVLERSYRPEVENFELKVLQESRFHGQWSLLTYKPNAKINVNPVESQARNLGLMFTVIGAVWIISKISNIDLTRQDKGVLITTTLSTSLAAVLLITTFAFKDFPEIIPAHRSWCEAWVLLSASTFIFVLVFLLQRVRLLLSGKVKASHNLRMQFECVLFMLAMYIMGRYVPVIHKGVSVRYLLTHKFFYLIHFLVPEVVLDFSNKFGDQAFLVGKNMAEIYSKLLPELEK